MVPCRSSRTIKPSQHMGWKGSREYTDAAGSDDGDNSVANALPSKPVMNSIEPGGAVSWCKGLGLHRSQRS